GGGGLVVGAVLQVGRAFAAVERVALQREVLGGRRGRRVEGDDLALVGKELRVGQSQSELLRRADVEELEEAAVELIVADRAAERELQLRVGSDLGRAVRGEDGDQAGRRRGARDGGRLQGA